MLCSINTRRCDPPFDDRELREIAETAALYEPLGEPRPIPRKPRPGEWLLGCFITYGGLTVLVGEFGVGKSLFTCWLASLVTETFGEYALFLSADDPARMIRPRLEAAGADLRKVGLLQARAAGVEDGVALPADTSRIANIVRRKKATDVLRNAVLPAWRRASETRNAP